MDTWDHIGEFEYQRETYDGYSIGKIILDIRRDFIEVETLYHKKGKNVSKVIKHGFMVQDGDVNIDDLLDKVYKMHI